MQKDSMFSIKDFSKLTGIKETSLRYYDELGLFVPAVRSASGYRYYSPFQLISINSIKLLQDLDIPIKEISKIERSRTPDSMLRLLTKKSAELSSQLSELEATFAVVRTLRRMISIGLYLKSEEIDVKYLEELPLTMGPRNTFDADADFYAAFIAYCEHAQESGTDLRLPIGGYWDSWNNFVERPNQPTRFFSIDPNGNQIRSSGCYLTGYTHGYYGETGDLTERMSKHMADNDLTVRGGVYCAYLLDEISLQNPDDYLLQVSAELVI
ncbi:MAG: MerR family DNA-binding transcriptional regulator [Coriobacteriales bacterium]|nr:MerR family DNA-binding transcriptional regulator [Coriobacteriales bacterium]